MTDDRLIIMHNNYLLDGMIFCWCLLVSVPFSPTTIQRFYISSTQDEKHDHSERINVNFIADFVFSFKSSGAMNIIVPTPHVLFDTKIAYFHMTRFVKEDFFWLIIAMYHICFVYSFHWCTYFNFRTNLLNIIHIANSIVQIWTIKLKKNWWSVAWITITKSIRFDDACMVQWNENFVITKKFLKVVSLSSHPRSMVKKNDRSGKKSLILTLFFFSEKTTLKYSFV